MNLEINKVIESFKRNNIEVIYLKDLQEIFGLLDERIKDQMSIGIGGSMTLFETGIIDYLKNRKINYLDRYQEELSKEELFQVFDKSLTCDIYLTSSNAITADGYLYNIDRTGNRVAAMTYGPKKVIVVAGTNKLVQDIPEAINRLEKIAAPKNCLRLNKDTPCSKIGYCVHCHHEDKLCSFYSIIGHQYVKNRITVVLINGNYGF